MRVLITGATGYIGSKLAAECVRVGDETHVVVRPSSSAGRLPAGLAKDAIHVFDGSLQSLLKALDDSQPDVVAHLASLFIVQHTAEQVPLLITSNVLFGSLLLEAMSARSVRRFINTGSFWQHYELQERNPSNLYAATKSAFAEVLRYYVEATPMKAVTLELPDTFGPDDPRRKIVNILIDSVRRNSPLDLTAGDQMLDLVHVDDVVDAFRSVMTAANSLESKSGIFTVSSGRPLRLRDLVSLISSISGNVSCLRLGARPYRFREVMAPWSPGAALPGWHPRKSIEDFLREQILPQS